MLWDGEENFVVAKTFSTLPVTTRPTFPATAISTEAKTRGQELLGTKMHSTKRHRDTSTGSESETAEEDKEFSSRKRKKDEEKSGLEEAKKKKPEERSDLAEEAAEFFGRIDKRCADATECFDKRLKTVEDGQKECMTIVRNLESRVEALREQLSTFVGQTLDIRLKSIQEELKAVLDERKTPASNDFKQEMQEFSLCTSAQLSSFTAQLALLDAYKVSVEARLNALERIFAVLQKK